MAGSLEGWQTPQIRFSKKKKLSKKKHALDGNRTQIMF